MTDIEHERRIRKVLDFIECNLHQELRLENIAKEGCYSPYYFHRLFKFIIGETLQEYINRKRIEKSAILLSKNPYISLGDIYVELGFNSHSVFCKTFKKYYGVCPTTFRKIIPKNYNKILQKNNNIGQKSVVFEKYICSVKQIQKFMKNAKIEVRQMPKMYLASVTSIGIQNVENAFNKVINWGVANNIFPGKSVKMISVYHDSFKVTPADKVRINACMLLEKPMTNEGEVFSEILPEGKYIVGNFFIGLNEFEQAWNGLFLWMSENGFQFRRAFPYEIYHTNYNEHPDGKMSVDFCIPIN